MQGGSAAGAQGDFCEGRRVVAGVGAVEQRVGHDAHAQAAVGVGACHGFVDAREDVAGDEQLLADLQAHPAGAGVLADGHAVLLPDAGVFQQAVQHGLRTRLRLVFAGCLHGGKHVGAQVRGAAAHGAVHGVGHGVGGERAWLGRGHVLVFHVVPFLLMRTPIVRHAAARCGNSTQSGERADFSRDRVL